LESQGPNFAEFKRLAQRGVMIGIVLAVIVLILILLTDVTHLRSGELIRSN